MALTTKDRTELREELVGQGYSWEYIDEWQPKITLYRHAAKMSTNGDMISPAGTAVKGLPGNPDYVARKAKLGMLPYLPNDTCVCRWCADGKPKSQAATVTEEEDDSQLVKLKCSKCSYFTTSSSKAGALSALRAHSKAHK